MFALELNERKAKYMIVGVTKEKRKEEKYHQVQAKNRKRVQILKR